MTSLIASDLEVVILAGGLGTRLSEETQLIPKPMVSVGSMPILWHIMKHYHSWGFKKFTIALGYKGYVIKEFFANYALHKSDVTIDFSSGVMTYHENRAEDWSVTLVDTGEDSMTGGRLGRLRNRLDSTFALTYGDGLSNVDLGQLLEFHSRQGKLATVTTVQPPGRFGSIESNGDMVVGFDEKPVGDGKRINGGFFLMEPAVFDYISGDATVLETDVLPVLAQMSELSAFRHDGFWQPMDTLRDKKFLEEILASGSAPWVRDSK